MDKAKVEESESRIRNLEVAVRSDKKHFMVACILQ